MERRFPYDIILGSRSPRRAELLKQLFIPFEVKDAEVEEIFPLELDAYDVPLYLAKKKADAFTLTERSLVIAADTLVLHGGQIYGKPQSLASAREMLQILSGSMHEVVTGVTIKNTERQVEFSSKTKVYFSHLTEGEIDWYIHQFNPLDKAGSYGIQDWIGIRGVTSIEGSYTNVLGLPTEELYRQLVLHYSL